MDLQADKVIIVPRIFNRRKLDDALQFLSFYQKQECARILINNHISGKMPCILRIDFFLFPLKDFKSYALHENN